MNPPHVYVLIPTYRELPQLQSSLAALAGQTYAHLAVAVINSHPGDETSAYLRSHPLALPVEEVPATEADFWTGAINRGLAWVRQRAQPQDYVLFLNSDVRIPPNLIEYYLELARRHPRAMFCAATASEGYYLSSGCAMRSWMWSLTRHPLLGEPCPASDRDRLIPLDMLAGRAMFFPTRLLDEIETVDAALLPHYGADYVFSCRAKREAGYELYLAPAVTVEVEGRHTGNKMYHAGVPLPARLRALYHIKSAANLTYRLRFVKACYPRHALLTASAVTIAKSLFEAVLGPAAYRLLGKRYR